MSPHESQSGNSPPVPRRSFLTETASAAAAMSFLSYPDRAQVWAADSELAAMRHRRTLAARRRRRVIFNNDGDDALHYRKEGTDMSSVGSTKTLQSETVTPESFLDIRMTPILGTHIDSVFYADSQSFGSFLHASEVAEVFTTTLDRGDGGPSWNITRDLIEQGTDPLRLAVDFCRQNDIEVFSSIRMNDIHDGRDYVWSNAYLPQFKKDHPEYLFGTKDDKLSYGYYTGVDYAQPAVRERAFLVLEDICRRYDIDGLELDYWRHPPFFRNYAVEGRPATSDELGQMTELLRRVRTMTEQVSLERDRPILIAVRVPDSAAACRSLGLDLERWLSDDLVDLLIAGEVQLSPWEETVALGHRYDVPVYPCIRPAIKSRRGVGSTAESYRAMAMNIWNSGADGIYTFNMFKTRDRLYHELGDPGVLQQLDKVYRLDPVGYSMAQQYFNAEQFLRLPVVSPRKPLQLEFAQPFEIPFPVGEDVLSGQSEGVFPYVTLRLQVEKLDSSRDLTVQINNEALDKATVTDGWVQFDVPPVSVRKGLNIIIITSVSRHTETPVLSDLELRIRYSE